MGADDATLSLLRFATAGSVDDGKSTLVGRLMNDTKSILADAYEALERVSRDRGLERADLALLTDGLRAEREQGITIDVAYRYFSTPRRTFILADCPGHVQYTRNAVTGASTADALVILVDARHGVVEQTRRHLAVAALLRVPHVIVAVNKIDLVGFAQAPFTSIADLMATHARSLGLPDLTCVPVSALDGDNVAEPSLRTPWYGGPTILELLETLPSADEIAAAGEGTSGLRRGWRLSVQTVLRPQEAAVAPKFRDYRGYGGLVVQGTLRVGDDVVVQPRGTRSRVSGIDTADGPLDLALPGLSVVVRLEDEIDIARGDLLSSASDAAEPQRNLRAHVAWLSNRPLRTRDRVLVQHGSALVAAIVIAIDGILDVSLPGGTLEASTYPGSEFGLNDIGLVTLHLASPLAADEYATHRTTGAFCLVDPQDGSTLGAGTVRAPNLALVSSDDDHVVI
jgi:sulfate adenylyltransferase subunit 1